METAEQGRISVVTGAFGFSGQEVARLLLARGETVRTLTNHPDQQSPIRSRVEVYPLDFHDRDKMYTALRGADVLYNTYWVRFPYRDQTHARAVENTLALLRSAEAAGISRIVHVSITKPSVDSPLSYFRGKAELESAIRKSSLSHAILRPAVLFGDRDILINNIAYMLRHFPVFLVPGRGNYGIQPIYVKDLAALAIEGGYRTDSYTLDAVGPEAYTYEDLVRMIRSAIGSKAVLMHSPAGFVRCAARVLGRVVKDVVLTDQEVDGLMADLLVSDDPPTGTTSLRDWMTTNATRVGRRYSSELARHYVEEKRNEKPLCSI